MKNITLILCAFLCTVFNFDSFSQPIINMESNSAVINMGLRVPTYVPGAGTLNIIPNSIAWSNINGFSFSINAKDVLRMELSGKVTIQNKSFLTYPLEILSGGVLASAYAFPGSPVVIRPSGSYGYLDLTGGLNVQQGLSAAGIISNGTFTLYGSQSVWMNNTIEFGSGLNKTSSAGKIGYQTFSDGLDIVGSESPYAPGVRKITFWNEGGANFNGPINLNSGAANLNNGNDINLKAASTDAGDIVFKKSDNTELARIFSDPTGNGNLNLSAGSATTTAFTINKDGQVAIGAFYKNTDAKLSVKGFIYSQKAIVTQLNWADDEFSANAKMPSLTEEENITSKEQHLIGVPTESELLEKGLDLGDMQAIQMRKIEQLYKHMFVLSKENAALKADIQKLKMELKK